MCMGNFVSCTCWIFNPTNWFSTTVTWASKTVLEKLVISVNLDLSRIVLWAATYFQSTAPYTMCQITRFITFATDNVCWISPFVFHAPDKFLGWDSPQTKAKRWKLPGDSKPRHRCSHRYLTCLIIKPPSNSWPPTNVCFFRLPKLPNCESFKMCIS